jgi:hypothetical protein
MSQRVMTTLEEFALSKQQIVSSRSFGKRITSKVAMQQALFQYTTRASEELRSERQLCRRVDIFSARRLMHPARCFTATAPART